MKTKSAGLTDVGFWQRFWARFSLRPRLEDGDTAYPVGAVNTEAGADVTPDYALRMSAVWACVGLRAQVVASMPLHAKGPDKRPMIGHPLYDLLHLQPNGDMSTYDWLITQVASMDLWGNGVNRIWRNDSRDRIVALTPMNPEKVRIKRIGNRMRFFNGSEDQTGFDEDDILHFKGFSLDGLVGLSCIQYAAETVGGAMAANQAAAREFRNGMKAGGFLKTPAGIALDDPQRLKMTNLLSRFSQPENAGKFMVLEHGIEVAGAEKIRVDPIDAQLLESRYFGIEEICRAFGRVPPPLIGHTDKASSWASSLANLNQGFLTYCIRPTMVSMEQTMLRKLLTRPERRDVSIKFNFRGLLRSDFAGQSAGYTSALSNGWMNIDEVRDLEDLPPLPDGKGQEYRVPMNTEPAGTSGQQQEQ